MPKHRRVVFSFDDRSLESLRKMTEQGSPHPTCPHCTFKTLPADAYREVTVKNPETGKERVIVIPKLG
jgi:hypothetical protein